MSCSEDSLIQDEESQITCKATTTSTSLQMNAASTAPIYRAIYNRGPNVRGQPARAYLGHSLWGL
jgi:hypothetical protein